METENRWKYEKVDINLIDEADMNANEMTGEDFSQGRLFLKNKVRHNRHDYRGCIDEHDCARHAEFTNRCEVRYVEHGLCDDPLYACYLETTPTEFETLSPFHDHEREDD